MDGQNAKWAAFLEAHPRISATCRIATGQGLKRIADHVFDEILYPLAIIAWGPFVGGGIMTFFAFVFCFTLLIHYHRLGVDWLGAGAIEKTRKKVLPLPDFLWNPIVFVLSSTFADSFETVIYLRKGRFGKLTKKDWAIFWGSLLLSNLIWIALCTSVIELIKALWQKFF